MKQEFIQRLFRRNYHDVPGFPEKDAAGRFADELFSLLFVPLKGQFTSEAQLQAVFKGLRNTFSTLLFDVLRGEAVVEQHAQQFFDAVPAIYEKLLLDADAVVLSDPAAGSLDEVFVAYPGFYATVVYRFAHQLYLQQVPVLPRILSEYAHGKTGIDIHPGAVVGDSFFIDHGTGIVIGETAVIGNHVKIYQGVTIGALHVSKELARQKRHPTIGDNVIIYSGASILGGETLVGHDSIIGGNVWLTAGVEPYSVVYHKSEIVIRDKFPLPEPLNFII